MSNIELKKQINQLNREAAQKAKRDTCLICGKSCTSFCNSHIIPQFILKSIADDGIVLQGTSAFNNDDEDLSESRKGVNNTWTFKVICNDCDKKYFADYENEQALMAVPTTRLMAEIALKNNMMQLAKRYNEIASYSLMKDAIIQKELLDEEQQLDVRDYLFDFKRAKKIIDKNLKSGYVLMFHHVLNYVTPIAMQGPITIHRDIDGEIVNDVNDYNHNIKMQALHVGIFPLKNSTAVLAFYHKDDRSHVKFDKKFSRLNINAKLQYLNYLVFKYCEYYAISPNIDGSVLLNEKLSQLVLEHYDYPSAFISEDNWFMLDKPLIDWREIPNLLDEKFKLR